MDSDMTNSTAGRLKAGMVHLLTASGSVIGLLGLAATCSHDWRTVFLLMLASVIIDSVDGSLARICRVKEVLPHIDGALMDNLVDFINYALLPSFVLLLSDILPIQLRLAGGSLVLLSACYQFSHREAKTSDHFFRGFPSYWNLLVIYLHLLETPTWFNAATIVFFAALAFLPVYFVYPSRTETLKTLTLWMAAPWIALIVAAVWLLEPGSNPQLPRVLTFISLYYILYYSALSLILSIRRQPASGNQQPPN